MKNILNYNFWMVFLSAILVSYIYILVYQIISEKEIKFGLKQRITLLITAFLVTFNNLYNPIIPISSIVSTVIYLITYKLLFQEQWKITICKTCIMTLISYVLDPVLSISVSFACNNIEELNINTIPKIFLTVIFSYTYYIIFKIKKLGEKLKSLLTLMESSNKILIYFISLIIIAHVYNVLMVYNYVDYKYYASLLVIIVFVTYYSYIFINEIYNNKSLTIKNKYLNDYLSNYEKTADNYRILKHNLKNDLFIIECAKDKSNAIKKIYQKYNEEEEWVNNISSFPSGLQGIIFLKMQFAETNNIKFYMDNKLKFNELDESTQLYLDTCEVIAICLDNAIEASMDTEKKLICMGLYDDEDCYTIDITNT
ncbi:MAG: GHKL domain-containing protein, partial [bacterium]|nr:GHKL domain-containing protein [bacterium]